MASQADIIFNFYKMRPISVVCVLPQTVAAARSVAAVTLYPYGSHSPAGMHQQADSYI